ncbi:MAG: hypothetical protein MI723_01620, partial [Caulobacterales bacterium]|nr:hypothetical protein [Caulobacterales bacterium]
MALSPDRLAPWLLKSKVTPPRQLASTISRPRLVERVEEGAAGAVVILEAPGGYGKSSLLSEWRHQRLERGQPVAWLSVDEDDDAETFITYLAYACHVAGVEVDSAVLTGLHAPSEASMSQAIYEILASIERLHEDVAIVIDDFERLSASVKETTVPLIVRRLPANAAFLFAARESVGVSTVDLDHRGLALRLGARELRFSRAEIAQLWGKRLSAKHIERLETNTQGWPVLVRMLLSAHDIGAFDIRHVDQSGFSDHSITTYFEEKILGRLEPEVRDCLLTASILEDVARDAFDAIVRDEPSDLRFEALFGLEVFVAPLSEQEDGFRLHPMMRAYLRHQLKETKPSAYRRLQLRAARWYSSKGNHVRAVKHAVEADDRRTLLSVIENTGSVVTWLREGLVQFRAIDRYLSEDIVAASPAAAIIRAIIKMKTGKPQEAASLLALAEAASDETDSHWRRACALV